VRGGDRSGGLGPRRGSSPGRPPIITKITIVLRRTYDGRVFIDDESYAALVEEVEDLRDRLSVYERTGETIPFAQLVGDLGLNGEVYAAPAS
jgi:hypothetical protein